MASGVGRFPLGVQGVWPVHPYRPDATGPLPCGEWVLLHAASPDGCAWSSRACPRSCSRLRGRRSTACLGPSSRAPTPQGGAGTRRVMQVRDRPRPVYHLATIEESDCRIERFHPHVLTPRLAAPVLFGRSGRPGTRRDGVHLGTSGGLQAAPARSRAPGLWPLPVAGAVIPALLPPVGSESRGVTTPGRRRVPRPGPGRRRGRSAPPTGRGRGRAPPPSGPGRPRRRTRPSGRAPRHPPWG